MKTQIYNSYQEFLSRTDKKENGVSKEFAEENPNFEVENLTCNSCFNCRGCRGCRNCRGCSGCRGFRNCRDCRYCSYCIGCSDCSYCSYCIGCSDCSYCSGESTNKKQTFLVPVLEHIHQKILEAVTPPENTLNMAKWHTCGTTHCRAGWVVHLAGKPGYFLEKQTSTAFAAMMIYKKSSPNIKVSPVRFFETNEEAFKDIERCAKAEQEIS